MTRKNDVALDKIVITGFVVKDIEDVYSLVEQNVVTVNSLVYNHLYTKTGERYNYIRIRLDGLFDSFTYGISNSGRISGKLEISVNDSTNHNLEGLSVSEYRERIDLIRKHLASKYGIAVDFRDARFSSIEIQKTVALDNSYSEYKRVFNLIVNSFMRRARLYNVGDFYTNKIQGRETNNISKTYVMSTNTKKKSFKIYDKSNQLYRICDIKTDGKYARFEITLCGSRAIKGTLGIDKVFDINAEDITNYFNQFFKKYVVDSVDYYEEEKRKYIKSLYKEYFVNQSYGWIKNLLARMANDEISSGVPKVLDVEEVISIVEALKKSDSKQRYYDKTQFREISRNICPVFSQSDDRKLRELLEKLL